MMRNRRDAVLVLGLNFVLASCGGEAVGASTESVKLASLDEVSAAEWEALASRKIFFGHQSVGRDMMEGVRELLAERPDIGLRLVQTEDPTAVEGAALIDARIGENRKPQSKADAFAEILEKGLGPDAIAMYKYCYVDVNENTDIEALFNAYLEQVRELEREHPEVTLVHITLPLKTAPTGVKENLKNLLGLPTETAINVKRNWFNDRLREEFAGRAPFFDLALYESTRTDGTRAFTRYRSQVVYMLAPEWTYDNGHLNEAGRRYIAEQFLVTLARIASAQAGAEVTRSSDASQASAQSL